MLKLLEPSKKSLSAEEFISQRKAELTIFLEHLDAALRDVNQAMRDFRLENCVYDHGRIAFVSDDPHSRVRLESEWRSLVLRRDDIYRSRNSCMAELASLIVQS